LQYWPIFFGVEMKKAKVFFPVNHNYNGRVFEQGQTYELEEECPGFIKRWLERGCTIVEDKIVVQEEKIVEITEVEIVEEPAILVEEVVIEENASNIVEEVEEKKAKKKTIKK